jgi:hypothetical protein
MRNHLRLKKSILLPLAFSVSWLLAGCATCKNGPAQKNSFDPRTDGFAYSNELVWVYLPDANGEMHSQKRDPEPTYYHHCFPMVRAAREFFYHAEFDPTAPRTSVADYKARVKQVVDRDSRCPAPASERIVIPGFANLHEFSAAYPDLLKASCGRTTASYLQRGNWRMVFPFSRYGQQSSAQDLRDKISRGLTPIVHLTNFPTHTINHVILLYAVSSRDGTLLFEGYDPNDPSRPAQLTWAGRHFRFERNNYFAGGEVNIYEVYRNALF